jgi:beta-mannosidase
MSASTTAPPAMLRQPLPAARWRLCAQSTPSDSPPDAHADWLDIGDTPQPVAAALAAAGRWSLDGPVRDFDSEVWWYEGTFDAPEDLDAPWQLGLDGLATLATVWLNGVLLLSSHNMFRRWVLPAQAHLRPGTNTVWMRFDALNTALTQRRPRPRWRVPMLSQQQLRWWRTTLLGRTPGWSPPAPVIGPWQPVWLGQPEPLATQVMQRSAVLESDTGRYRVALNWQGASALRAATLVLGRNGAQWSAPLNISADTAQSGHAEGEAVVPQAERWWPHTHGKPALYTVALQLITADGRSHSVVLPDCGFRDLQVDSSQGGLAFSVNGVRVFARGACWTPLDILRLHGQPATYNAAIAQVARAGMNMLRIVGSMAWESPAFFDACDRHGVLVWHDLMFSNMDYPGDDPAFAAEVQAELADQLPALQARPSLALVCGNSEVSQQAAMWGADPALWAAPLFHQHLPAWLAEALPGVAYWPSSAWGGDFPHQPREGSCSYYGVGAYQRELNDASHCGVRFAAECLAFANIPGDATLARLPGHAAPRVHTAAWKARSPRDLGAGWDFDDVREHYVERLFGERPDALRYADPARHLLLGRAASAEAMARTFTRWRASGSRCDGALVWLLRDLWAGAGWGLLDDAGEPKAAFEALSRVLQPLWIGVLDDGLNGLDVHWAHEHDTPLDAVLQLRIYQHGQQLTAQSDTPLITPGRGQGRLALTTLLGGFRDLNHAYRFGPAANDLIHATLRDRRSGALLAETLHFAPETLAQRSADVGLSAHAEAQANGTLRVTLRSERAALGVHVQADGWRCDSSLLHLPPGGLATLDFSPRHATTRAWRATAGALNSHALVVIPVSSPPFEIP